MAVVLVWCGHNCWFGDLIASNGDGVRVVVDVEREHTRKAGASKLFLTPSWPPFVVPPLPKIASRTAANKFFVF